MDAALFEVPSGFRQVHHIDASPKEDWRTAWVNGWAQLTARVERLFWN